MTLASTDDRAVGRAQDPQADGRRGETGRGDEGRLRRDLGQEGRCGGGALGPVSRRCAGTAARRERTEAGDPGRDDHDDQDQETRSDERAPERTTVARSHDEPPGAERRALSSSWRGSGLDERAILRHATCPRSSPQLGQNRMSPMRSVPHRGQKRGPGAAMVPPGLAAAARSASSPRSPRVPVGAGSARPRMRGMRPQLPINRASRGPPQCRVSASEVGDMRRVRAVATMRRMKTTKGDRDGRSSKAARRTSRKTKDRGRHDDRLAMRVLGGTMDHELFERVLAAAQSLDLDAPVAGRGAPRPADPASGSPPVPAGSRADARLRPARRLDGLRHRLRAGLHACHREPGRALGHRPRDAARDRAREPACADGRRAAARRADPPGRRRDDRDPGPGLGLGADPRPGRPPPDPRRATRACSSRRSATRSSRCPTTSTRTWRSGCGRPSRRAATTSWT